jgi:hypothetical protein
VEVLQERDEVRTEKEFRLSIINQLTEKQDKNKESSEKTQNSPQKSQTPQPTPEKKKLGFQLFSRSKK